MVVEMRTYSFHPGMTPAALARIEQGVAERSRLSPLGALWYSDVGRLHQIVHLWPYDDLAHREAVRGRFGELKNWPARTGEYTAESETKIMRPAPFSPPLAPRKCGPVFEICTDTYKANGLEKILERWTPRIDARAKLAPLVGAWHTVLGPMNQWIHIWAYESVEARSRVRSEAARDGSWPPADGELFVKQESGLFFPAAFSPIQ